MPLPSFKLTAWNIEHADKLLTALDSSDATKKRHAEARAEAITEEIAMLDADILFVCEGPHGEARARDFFDRVAPQYTLVTRNDAEGKSYGFKGGAGFAGRQWMWFLIKTSSGITGQLLHLDRWKDMCRSNAGGDYDFGKWPVSFPEWIAADEDAGTPEKINFDIAKTHSHWRHPQVLQADIDGAFVEIIGCHLKSKYNTIEHEGEPLAEDFFANNPELVAELVKARVKLTTECVDIRHYIDARFAEDESAAIVVVGDLNDGPGKERIEARFLYHDLVSNLQGDIFFARRFLNHALFDCPEGERWSYFLDEGDALDPGRHPYILLDHILMSQSMTHNHPGPKSAFQAFPGQGRVEHEVHHRVTSTRFKYAMTSDHKPLSMIYHRDNPNVGV